MKWDIKVKKKLVNIVKDDYKNIPYWIINHLLFYGNCGIAYNRKPRINQFKEIGMTVSNFTNGVLVLEDLDKKTFKENYGGEFDEQYFDRIGL